VTQGEACDGLGAGGVSWWVGDEPTEQKSSTYLRKRGGIDGEWE